MPEWFETINLKDVFHSDELEFKDRRDIIVRRLRGSRWIKDPDRRIALDHVVEGLEESEDYTEFNGWWNELYDYADSDRVWIETF